MHVRSLLMVASAAILVSTVAFGQAASDTVFQIHPITGLGPNAAGQIIDAAINVTNSGASIGQNYAVNSGAGPFGNAGSINFGGATGLTSNTSVSFVSYGNICVNLYAFSADEQLQSCCSCQLSPNALGSWDVFSDIDNNTLTGARPKDLVIKLVATGWNGSVHSSNNGPTTFVNVNNTIGGLAPTVCNPAIAGQPISVFNIGFPGTTSAAFGQVPQSVLVNGMVAYARTQVIVSALASLVGGTESAFEPSTLSMGTGTVYAGEPSPAKELDNITRLCAFNQQNGSGAGVCKGCHVGGQ